MSTLIVDLRMFKNIILESFLQGLTPRACAIKLGQKGFNPPPTEEDLRDDSPYLETMKQLLTDEFFKEEKVQNLMNAERTVSKMNKETFEVIRHVLPKDRIVYWFRSAYLKMLKTKFDFELPPSELTQKKSVLVIADELGQLLKEVLEKEGFDVSIVKSYGLLEEVYSELGRRQYDLVIPTNNSLKPEHILELVPEMKKRQPKIRIIVMSGYYPHDFVSHLERNGADSFLPAPYKMDEVVRKIKDLLSV